MENHTATTAKPLPIAERKARLAKLVASGKVSAKRAGMVDFREPSAAALAFAKKLVPGAKKHLDKGKRAAA